MVYLRHLVDDLIPNQVNCPFLNLHCIALILKKNKQKSTLKTFSLFKKKNGKNKKSTHLTPISLVGGRYIEPISSTFNYLTRNCSYVQHIYRQNISKKFPQVFFCTYNIYKSKNKSWTFPGMKEKQNKILKTLVLYLITRKRFITFLRLFPWTFFLFDFILFNSKQEFKFSVFSFLFKHKVPFSNFYF